MKFFGLKLNEVKDKVRVKKFAFTGGEPTLNYKQFQKTIKLTREHFPEAAFVLNSNGLNLMKVKNDIEIQAESKHKNILHLSCNLIKGYIDSKEEVYKYLEWANSIGIQSVGFVSLMPVNDFCKENLIDFSALDLVSERFNLTKVWTYEHYCRCSNYVYIPEKLNDNVIRVYYKNTYNPYDININLVFDGENLTTGFTNEVIL